MAFTTTRTVAPLARSFSRRERRVIHTKNQPRVPWVQYMYWYSYSVVSSQYQVPWSMVQLYRSTVPVPVPVPSKSYILSRKFAQYKSVCALRIDGILYMYRYMYCTRKNRPTCPLAASTPSPLLITLIISPVLVQQNSTIMYEY